MIIKFTIPGKPVPQGRPRFYRRGKFVAAVDPKGSRSYKADISHMAKIEKIKLGFGENELCMASGPVRLTFLAFFPCPKSQYRKKKPKTRKTSCKKTRC